MGIHVPPLSLIHWRQDDQNPITCVRLLELVHRIVPTERKKHYCMSILEALADWQLFGIVVVGPVLFMIVGTLLLHLFLKKREKNAVSDLHRATFSSLSTILAFLLGFLIVTTWGNYRTADQAVAQEAAVITTTVRDAQALPLPAKSALIGHLHSYTEDVMTDEWPLMAQGAGAASPKALKELSTLWSVCSGKASTQVGCSNVQSDLDRLSTDRALRLDSSEGTLPNDLWLVLVVCCIAMLFMSFLLYTHDVPLVHQIVTRVLLTAAFASLFWLIITLANPYAGGISVTPHAFAYPLLIMRTLG